MGSRSCGVLGGEMPQVNARKNREYLNRYRFARRDGSFRLGHKKVALERDQDAPRAQIPFDLRGENLTHAQRDNLPHGFSSCLSY